MLKSTSAVGCVDPFDGAGVQLSAYDIGQATGSGKLLTLLEVGKSYSF